VAAIAPVVQAGLAVTVLPPSAMRAGLRVVPEDESLPALPRNRIGIFEGETLRSPEGKALAEEIRATLLGGVHNQVQDGQNASPATGDRFVPARHRVRSVAA
jgi:DNA-binding transcriptional LysR family regulator